MTQLIQLTQNSPQKKKNNKNWPNDETKPDQSQGSPTFDSRNPHPIVAPEVTLPKDRWDPLDRCLKIWNDEEVEAV